MDSKSDTVTVGQKLKLAFNLTSKWVLFSLTIGSATGSSSALFLYLLDLTTLYRESNSFIIFFLPVAGVLIGFTYKTFGSSVTKGNNLLLEEIHSPRDIIPFRMAPLILFGTLITHLFGGSAGREGTAVQMGGSISHQLTKFFKYGEADRKLLIILGISGGFSSVFGTPIAGAIFALEVIVIGRLRYEYLFPSILTAIIANQICDLYGIQHTNYPNISHFEFTWSIICYVILIGIFSGLVSRVFILFLDGFTHQFRIWIPSEILRPGVGGLLIVILYVLGLESRFLGLGLPTIVESFHEPLPGTDFFTKLYMTTLTLGSGFKGGEVTPLFFIGATFGNLFAQLFSLPLETFAALGFVAVFAGATNTPLACTLMGIELFGGALSIPLALVTSTAYLFSGHVSIYSSQIIGSPKLFASDKKGKRVSELNRRN